MLIILSALLIFSQCCTLSSAQPNFVHYKCDNAYGNYTTNSTYQQNLNTLLSDVSSNTQITFGFYNFSYGKDPNIVKGIALCRGDVLLDECRSCLKNATAKLSGLCPNQKQAIGWYDRCMLRYSNRSIFGVMEIIPGYWIRNPMKALYQQEFNGTVSSLFGSLLNKAAGGNSTLKFAMNKTIVSAFVTVYAHTQCTPDLTRTDCYYCLSESISNLPNFLPYQGARFFRASCNIQYEVYKYSTAFDALENSSEAASPAPLTSGLSPPSARKKGKGSKTSKIVAIVVVTTTVCLVLVAVICLCLRQNRRKWKTADNELEEEDEIINSESLQISYGDVKDATQGFAEANKLEKGGFGIVYKGVLANGQTIAVKRLAKNSVQGEAEFRTEVLLLAKLQHRNLVRLLGYSLEREERLLIYEFVPNASLDHFLFGKTKHVSLDWHTRYNIIKGIARGLLYLHEDSRLRIIHRDLKASNILLDAQLNPKIADFGMARLFQADQTHADTERIAGTFGYMPPEYVYRRIFSVKSDVYSFDILILEIICGKQNSGILESESMEDLVTSVWRNWREETACKVVDLALGSASRAQIMRCIQIGLLCVQADPANRPTMSLVNLMLTSESQSMPMPCQPAYVLQRTMEVDPKSLNVTEEESITELQAR